MAKRRARRAPPADPNTTGLSCYEALLEATYLAALVSVPLFFNPSTERVFEPDKMAWVLLLGLMALGAHLVRAAERWLVQPSSELVGDEQRRDGGPAAHLRNSPLGWLLVLAALSLVAGTVASAVPTLSVWGAYRRGHGLLAYGAYWALLGAVIVTCRRRAAVDRLRRAVLIPVIPVALYALLQRFGVDSVPWEIYGAPPAERAFGPLGNPIFLGAYLVMALPLSLAGLMEAWEARRSGEARPASGIGGNAVVSLLALVGLVASQSRGPTLGLLVGLGLFFLLWAAVRGQRRLAVWVTTLGGVALAAMLLLGRLEDGGFGRLTALLAPSSRTARERLLVWDALGELAADHPGRALIGYGPETLAYVLPPHLQDELIRLTPTQIFDRAHNVVWEWWVSAGVLGVAALLLLYMAALYSGCRQLGLVPGRAAGRRLVGAMLAGSATGLLSPLALGAWQYGALGLPLGLLAGTAAYVLHAALTGTRTARRASRAGELLIIGVLAALAAHLVEGTVGLPTAAGELLFWVYLGLLVGLPRTPPPVAGAAPDAVAEGLLEGLALAAVAFSPLLSPSPAESLSSPALWLLLPATWLAADSLAGSRGNGIWSRSLARLAVLVVFLVLFLGFQGQTGGGAMAFGLLLAGTAVAMAIRLGGGQVAARTLRSWRWPAYGALALLLIAVAWRGALAPVIADAHIRGGVEAGVAGNLAGARGHFGRATDLWPEQPAYATYVAAAYRDGVINPRTPDRERREAFDAAVDVLTKALGRVPDDAIALRLATLYRDWGDLTGDEVDREQAWEQARGYFELALARYPHNPENLAEYGSFLERTGQIEPARQAYEKAGELNPGNLRAWSGLMRTALAALDVEGAAEALDRALAQDPGNPEPVERAVREAEDWPIDRLRTDQSRVLLLGATGRGAEAHQLLEDLARQNPEDGATVRLKDWLDRRGEE